MTITSEITLRPLPESWTPPAGWARNSAPAGADSDGEWQDTGYRAAVAYVLDVEDRALSVHPVASEADVVPGESVNFQHARHGVVPPVMQLGGLSLRTSTELARPDLINTLLEEVRPLAQTIADNLLPLAGVPGGRDWTAAAFDALRHAGHVLERRPYRGTEHDFPYGRPYMLDAAAVLAAFPSLVSPAWADATDQQLQDAAAALEYRIHGLAETAPDATEKLISASLTGARLPDDDHGRPVTTMLLYGARAWLHDYRLAQADGLTPTDITRWGGADQYALHAADDSTDAELAALARRAERDAASRGVKLLGAEAWARALRTERRAAVRAQLTDLRTQIGDLEDALRPARKRRTVLVTRVLGWGEDDTDSGLGRAAGLSHTAVGTIRTNLDTTTEKETD